MQVVNIIGEPGSGKSVTAAGLFYELSVGGHRVEVIPEVGKGYAWETPRDIQSGKPLSHPIFSQQIFLLGEQNRGLERVMGKRDIAIMECPLIMMAVYAPKKYFNSFESLVLEQFNYYNNINIVLERNHAFDQDGRVHSESESGEIKRCMLNFLEKYKIPHHKMQTHPEIHKEIKDLLVNQYLPTKNHTNFLF